MVNRGIIPLYINGKRDKARRYVLPSGEIISRRQYIKITEGVSPESKAYARYLAGLAPKGVTARKYEQRLKRRAEKIEPKRTTRRLRIVDRVKDEYVNLYQLVVTAVFLNTSTRQKAVARGYSTLTHSRYVTPPRYGTDYYYQKRAEALRHAEAQVMSRHAGRSGEWVVEEVIDEFWLRH